MYRLRIPINHTLKLIGNIADIAEMSVREHIKQYYHMSNEEMITHMFYGQMKYGLKKASEDGTVKKMVLRDLMAIDIGGAEIVQAEWDSLARIKVKGLIADLILHNRRQEGRTGGDFGLVVNRPLLELTNNNLTIVKGKRQGLLCQAKLKREDGKWGTFTESQIEVLPERFPYTALPLYSYGDESRTILNPIQWFSCKGKTFEEVQQKVKG